ncbi:hypothetical protein F0562_008717 [Nyssa sinensis]|uniref:Uncharacterized protein n=1 Tax=Nyssa sinensis TaxID=561372 RepID=A0A5J5AA03_9ASTE|nr:hypothetical protein F0562_008717 [Nyssa sinensis]
MNMIGPLHHSNEAMAGIAIVLDLLRKNPSLSGQTLHSYGLFSARLAASAAAASVAAGIPCASRALFGNVGIPVAHCDAGTSISEDYISSIQNACGKIFHHDSLKYSTKEYTIEAKTFILSLWFEVFHADVIEDTPEEHHVDLVVPFKKSVKQIIRETTVVTTRRVLERLAVHYISQRMAWKLLKDVPKSAVRKAERGMPTSVYFFCVSRTTFRGHFLAVAATWLVQVGIDIYRFFSSIFKPNEETDEVDKAEQVQLLAKKVCGTTIRCSASLVFASIGAGVGATLFRPSAGQWIGCAVGDLAGPVVVTFCFEKVLHVNL